MSRSLRSTRSATTPATGREQQHRDEVGEEEDAEPRRRLVGDVGHLGLERDERDPVADVADAVGGEEQAELAEAEGTERVRGVPGSGDELAGRGPGSPCSSSGSAGSKRSVTRTSSRRVRAVVAADPARRRRTLPPSTWSVVPVTTARGCSPGTRRRRRSRRRRPSRAAPCGRSSSGSPWVDGVAEALVAGGVDGVGRDGVDPDRPGRELERERLREAGHRGLHRRVHAEPGRRTVGLDRRDVDDRPAVGHHRHAARTKFVTLPKFSSMSDPDPWR